MKRIEVWIDCEDEQEGEARKKIEAVLDQLGFEYTILHSSSSIENKRLQK